MRGEYDPDDIINNSKKDDDDNAEATQTGQSEQVVAPKKKNFTNKQQ